MYSFYFRPIQLSTYPPSPPSADFAPGEIRMAGYYSIDVEVILDDGSVEPVATATAVSYRSTEQIVLQVVSTDNDFKLPFLCSTRRALLWSN